MGDFELTMKNGDNIHLHKLMDYAERLPLEGQKAILYIAKDINNIDINSEISEEYIKKIIDKYKAL